MVAGPGVPRFGTRPAMPWLEAEFERLGYRSVPSSRLPGERRRFATRRDTGSGRISSPAPTVVLIRNSRLSGGCEPDVDVEAKGFQTTDQRLCGAVALDGIEVAGAEILVEGAVAKHVIDGREYRGSDRDAGLFGSTSGL